MRKELTKRRAYWCNQAGTEQVKYCIENQTKERQDFNLEKGKNKNLQRTTVLTTAKPLHFVSCKKKTETNSQREGKTNILWKPSDITMAISYFPPSWLLFSDLWNRMEESRIGVPVSVMQKILNLSGKITVHWNIFMSRENRTFSTIHC